MIEFEASFKPGKHKHQNTNRSKRTRLGKKNSIGVTRHKSQINAMQVHEVYRIVICFAMSPPLPVTPPSLDIAEADPGFFSKIFQNLRLSSAAVYIN